MHIRSLAQPASKQASKEKERSHQCVPGRNSSSTAVEISRYLLGSFGSPARQEREREREREREERGWMCAKTWRFNIMYWRTVATTPSLSLTLTRHKSREILMEGARLKVQQVVEEVERDQHDTTARAESVDSTRTHAQVQMHHTSVSWSAADSGNLSSSSIPRHVALVASSQSVAPPINQSINRSVNQTDQSEVADHHVPFLAEHHSDALE
mgnify:CR=1 FL=1